MDEKKNLCFAIDQLLRMFDMEDMLVERTKSLDILNLLVYQKRNSSEDI